MILIDAYNIQSGGAVKHMNELLDSDFFNRELNLIWIVKKSHAKRQDRRYYIPISTYFGPLKYLIWYLIEAPIISKKSNASLYFSLGGILPFFIKEKKMLLFQNKLPVDALALSTFSRADFFYYKLLVLRALYFSSFKRASKVIFLTSSARDLVYKLGVRCDHEIIPHGQDQHQKQQTSTFVKPYQLLYISPIFPYKNHDKLIEVFARYIEIRPEAELILVGGGPKKYVDALAKKIKNLSLNGKINILPFQTQTELELLKAESGILIFFSLCENLPITIIEYLNHEKPVLTLDIPPMNEFESAKITLVNFDDDVEKVLSKLMELENVTFPQSAHDTKISDYTPPWNIVVDRTVNLLKGSLQ